LAVNIIQAINKGQLMQVIVGLLLLFGFSAFAEQVFVDGKEFSSLKEAKSAIVNGSQIYLKAGIYTKGIYIKASNIAIIGEENVIFDNAAVNGKAALVLTGDNVLVESIECRNIYVRDLNGACIRFEGENLTVRDVYAHDSQSGIMTSRSDGYLHIEYSTFERLGGKASGRGYAHAIYANVGEFIFSHSKVLSVGKEGSGLKTRSRKTIVKHSLLASLEAKDSRLIDAASYGELIIHDSILQQGVNSSNSQLIAYGLETKVKKKFDINRVEIKNNMFLFDRQKANVIVSHKQADQVLIENNTFIGDFLYADDYVEKNFWYLSREKAKLKPYPYMPNIIDLTQMVETISIIGERN
jgi:acetyltransferase-like isoleucine patch superfamily enzyme